MKIWHVMQLLDIKVQAIKKRRQSGARQQENFSFFSVRKMKLASGQRNEVSTAVIIKQARIQSGRLLYFCCERISQGFN